MSLLGERADVIFSTANTTEEAIANHINDLGFEAALLRSIDLSPQGRSGGAAAPGGPAVTRVTLRVKGMTCASCVSTIETFLKESCVGVERAVVDLLSEKATIDFRSADTNTRELITQIHALGFEATLFKEELNDRKEVFQRKEEIAKWRRLFFISLFFAVPQFVLMVLMWIPPAKKRTHSVMLVRGVSIDTFIAWLLATPVQFGLGLRFYISAYNALRHFHATMDVLIAVGKCIHSLTHTEPFRHMHAYALTFYATLPR